MHESNLIPQLTFSSLHYHRVRETLPKRNFHRRGEKPELCHKFKGKFEGELFLFPSVSYDEYDSPPKKKWEALRKRVEERRNSLTDLDADVLDILCSYWTHRKQNKKSFVWISTDEILHARGLQHKINGQRSNEDAIGRGYKPEQRGAVNSAIERISCLRLKIQHVPGEKKDCRAGPVLEFDGTRSLPWQSSSRVDSEEEISEESIQSRHQIRYRPGEVFRLYSWNQHMYQSSSLYNLRVNQSWEKRLARYYFWQWRISRKESVPMIRQVRKLLAPVVLDVGKRRFDLLKSRKRSGIEPASANEFSYRIRKRFQKALDHLADEEIAIKSWDYYDRSGNWTRKQNWRSLWLDAAVAVWPTPSIASAHDLKPEPEGQDVGPQIRHLRTSEGWSQREFLNKVNLGISQSHLSEIERGNTLPDKIVIERLEKFIDYYTSHED